MNYKQAIKYLESFIDYEKLNNYAYNKAFGLERIRLLLAALGNPQDELRCIHVAGTKGKGSTCAFIAYILREAGYKVGLYTSPHLSDFRERIRILIKAKKVPGTLSRNCCSVGARHLFEGMISKQGLSRLAARIKPLTRGISPTFFEVYTALAFLYFKEKKADFVVLETGLGGRLDATNVINPLISVITPISLEHTQYLGNTLCKIAEEKAGIIKGAPVITAPQEKEVLEVLRKKCKAVGARLHQPKIDRSLKPRLLGRHQLVNASVAKAAVEALELKIKPDVIRQGIRRTVWPGRCEVISRRPTMVLDGAQNIASAKAIKKAVRENFRYRRLILVLGISGDKDIAGICKEFAAVADRIILTKSSNPRAASPQTILANLANKSNRTNLTNCVEDAMALALKSAQKEDLILVAGSLFVVGEMRSVIASRTPALARYRGRPGK